MILMKNDFMPCSSVQDGEPSVIFKSESTTNDKSTSQLLLACYRWLSFVNMNFCIFICNLYAAAHCLIEGPSRKVVDS